jgi:MoaA/NifB/PqqE/SkfB family radical SAM enzyme
MDEKINRLKNWMQGKKEMPYTLEINPTNRCNLECEYCWQQNFEGIDKTDKISTQKLFSIVDEAAKIGVKEIRIPGSGEPLIRKDIIDLMQEIKKNNIHGLLITNGVLLNKEKINRIIDISWDCLTFSFDSSNRKVNDYFRGKGSFDILKKNLLLLKKIKKKKKSKFPLIRFNIVVTNKNYKFLTDIIKFASKILCEDVEFQPLTVWSDNSDRYKLTEKQQLEFKKMIPKIKSLAEKNEIYTNIGDFSDTEIVEKASGEMNELMNKNKERNKFLELPCFEPWYNMIILPEGKVTACSIAGSSNGDSILNKKLEDVWFGDYYNNLRKSLLEKKLPDYCKRCCAVVFVENQKIKDKLRADKNIE